MALPVRLSRLRLKKCERLPESTEGVVDGETLNLVIDKYHKSGISDRIYHKDFVEGNSRHNIDSLVDRSDLSLSLEHSTYIVDYLLQMERHAWCDSNCNPTGNICVNMDDDFGLNFDSNHPFMIPTVGIQKVPPIITNKFDCPFVAMSSTVHSFLTCNLNVSVLESSTIDDITNMLQSFSSSTKRNNSDVLSQFCYPEFDSSFIPRNDSDSDDDYDDGSLDYGSAAWFWDTMNDGDNQIFENVLNHPVCSDIPLASQRQTLNVNAYDSIFTSDRSVKRLLLQPSSHSMSMRNICNDACAVDPVPAIRDTPVHNDACVVCGAGLHNGEGLCQMCLALF